MADGGFELLELSYDRAWITDIHLTQPSSTAFRLNKSNCVAGACVIVTEAHNNIGTFFSKNPRNRSANATGCTCDKPNSVSKFKVHTDSVSR